MKLFRKVKALFRILNREYEWYHDTKVCRKSISPKTIQDVPLGKKIILMPHSDDEWIGCSQLLLRQSEQILVVNMDMTGGDSEQLHKTRRNEAESVAQKYGYRFITVQSRLKDLVQILADEQPKCVFLPCYLDWHEEHISVMKLFQTAAIQAGYVGLVGMYQVSLPIPERMINSGITMTKKKLQEKWKSLGMLYQTQAFLPTKRFMLNEHINGGITETYAVEAYAICEFQYWNREWKQSRLTEEEKKNCIDNLQRIGYIRTILQSRERIILNERS